VAVGTATFVPGTKSRRRERSINRACTLEGQLTELVWHSRLPLPAIAQLKLTTNTARDDHQDPTRGLPLICLARHVATLVKPTLQQELRFGAEAVILHGRFWLVGLHAVLSGNRRKFSPFGGSSWWLVPASAVEFVRFLLAGPDLGSDHPRRREFGLRNAWYNQTLASMDKTAIVISSLTDPSDDREHWLTRSPSERLQALELVRQAVYGYEPTAGRLQRILEVARRPPR
jgi:hypothetical protein